MCVYYIKNSIMKYNKKQLDSINYIQNIWRKTVTYKKDIVKELEFFIKICNVLVTSVETKYKMYIIQQLEYKKSVELLNYCIERISSFPKFITFKYMATSSSFKILSNLAKIKLGLIEITGLIGGLSVKDSIVLYYGKDIYNYYTNTSTQSYIEYLNNFFKIIKLDYYQGENNSYVLYNFTNKNTYTNSSIKLKKNQRDFPSLEKVNIISKNVDVRINSCKLLIPLGKNLIIFYGYFLDDNLHLCRSIPHLKSKYDILKESFNNLDLNTTFKNNFLSSLQTSEFIINSESSITNCCINAYSDIINLEKKNVSIVVKEFVTSDIEKQRYIIKNLLLNSYNETSIYLCNLLLDLLSSDSTISLFNSKNQILDSIHWSSRCKIKVEDDELDSESKVREYSEESIPYEKRINLMKTEEYIKNKAHDKLKEINGSKNGESTAKAQQYLDGLLKIPFGIYKNESIKHEFNNTISKIGKYENDILLEIQTLEENHQLNDSDLQYTAELSEKININREVKHNPLSLLKYIKSLKDFIFNKIFDLYPFIEDKDLFIKKFSTLSLVSLKNIVEDLKLKISSNKKISFIEKIYDCDKCKLVKVCNELFLHVKDKYVSIISTTEFINVIDHVENFWDTYLSYDSNRKNYFSRLDNILNNSVYGLDIAKTQIKRLLGQWANGVNQGYVFGFEGPPGTGKTTLAKTGISKCLMDENETNRPFIFIALGGSSNGSTLEGHNYTYVGSSWGRIIDGIIDSKCMNPIIYIDELDKISRTEHGREIVGILTHLTDTSQNGEFTDKYFSGIKFDLSKCLIIFSYNDPNLIDKILLDRIQRIKIDPLNRHDKIMVCKNFIIPEILLNIGFTADDILISDEVLSHIINSYTYEAGARKLKEKLYELYREINIKYLTHGHEILPKTITLDFVDEIFNDYDKFEITKIHDSPKVGLINGLFATSNGIGGITTIECVKFTSESHLELKLTGMQGDVMKESMNVAKNLCLNLIPDTVLSNISKDKNKFGIHIHCPSGATPKDGPSAGTAITVCLISLLCNIPIKNYLAITGEINLIGDVLPIGGLDSKVEGGKTAGVTRILAPELNKKDLAKIRSKKIPPEDDNFSVTLIKTIYQALNEILIMPENQTAEEYFKKI